MRPVCAARARFSIVHASQPCATPPTAHHHLARPTAALKAKAKSKELAEKRKQDRLRSIIVLCIDHLTRYGYIQSAQKLQAESGVNASRWEVADNIDLDTVLMEFEEYYKIKFARPPKFCRRAAGTETKTQRRAARARANRDAAERRPSSKKSRRGRDGSTSLPPLGRSRFGGMEDAAEKAGLQLPQYPGGRRFAGAVRYSDIGGGGEEGGQRRRGSVSGASPPRGKSGSGGGKRGKRSRKSDKKGLSLEGSAAGSSRPALPRAQSDASGTATAGGGDSGATPSDDNPYRRHEETPVERPLLKPMPHFETSELRNLASVITMDIYRQNPNVRWTDIAELKHAKQLLKEAVVMPLKYPQLFTGLLAPWKGILLYGPPGTGKTMLARAVATECKTTFFNISASSIVSKYRGDSEKLVRMLFELARYHAPSTIFIDELDSIMSERGASNNEHEGSRRLKTELLIQMDGLAKGGEMVFVLAASNLPWALDPAMLRRLEKRILVPLPNLKARRIMLQKNLPDGERATGLDYDTLASRTNTYSGSDIALMCKEAAMRPMRKLMKRLERLETAKGDQDDGPDEVKVPMVTTRDIEKAMACTKPSTNMAHIQKYEAWHAKHGSGNSEEGVSVSQEGLPAASPARAAED